MSKKELFKKVNELCIYLDSKYHINDGGCCYVAACLAEQLEKHNIPFSIVHYNICGCHYAIKVSDRYLNRCCFKKNEILEYLDWPSNKLFEYYNNEDWNETYLRKYNGCVKKYIKAVFDKYENCRT